LTWGFAGIRETFGPGNSLASEPVGEYWCGRGRRTSPRGWRVPIALFTWDSGFTRAFLVIGRPIPTAQVFACLPYR
jgi:hypothetical protein